MSLLDLAETGSKEDEDCIRWKGSKDGPFSV